MVWDLTVLSVLGRPLAFGFAVSCLIVRRLQNACAFSDEVDDEGVDEDEEDEEDGENDDEEEVRTKSQIVLSLICRVLEFFFFDSVQTGKMSQRPSRGGGGGL